MSHANGNYYSTSSDLHADHLQPASQIIDRQLELIDAMNLCPIFAQEMQEQYPDYFIQEKDIYGNESWFGCRKFFLDYYNCIDNLWLINGGANVGKQSNDPIDYLENHPFFGEKFFSDLRAIGPISKQGILYTVNDTPLATYAKEWFKNQYELPRVLMYIHTTSGDELKDTVIHLSCIEKDTHAKEIAVNNSSHELMNATLLSALVTEHVVDRSKTREQSIDGHISDSDSQGSLEIQIDAPIAKKVIKRKINGIMDSIEEDIKVEKKLIQQTIDNDNQNSSELDIGGL